MLSLRCFYLFCLSFSHDDLSIEHSFLVRKNYFKLEAHLSLYLSPDYSYESSYIIHVLNNI